MRIPSGVTDQVIYFVAVDSTDLSTRETGLSSFTVYRARNGAAAVAMTTPTVTEVDATNMPGVYTLLLDEDMTIGSGNDSEEMCFHITQASMAPVTRTIELYRPKLTAGETLTVSSGAATTDAYTRLGAPAGASVSADILAVKNDTAAILIDTGELQTDWVNGGRLDNILDALQSGNDAIEADTQDIQGRLPAALVGGRIDASIGAAAADTITASALATDAVNEIRDAIGAYVVDSQGSLSLKQALQGMFSTLCGETTVSGGTYTILTADGIATRITFTLDANKQRTNVSLNLVG